MFSLEAAVWGEQFVSEFYLFICLFIQTRTPRVTRLSPTQPALADQASRVSFASAENLETMSEPDMPIGFNRMNRLRQSLPLARSSSQAKLRAPGPSSSQLSSARGFVQ